MIGIRMASWRQPARAYAQGVRSTVPMPRSSGPMPDSAAALGVNHTLQGDTKGSAEKCRLAGPSNCPL
jgi:hypothetical protein